MALYQIRLHRNDKKPLQAQQSAEEEGEEGNLNNSDTNRNDIISLITMFKYYRRVTQRQ